MKVSNWQCDRCGNIDQTQVAVVDQGMDIGRPDAPLPVGWARTTIHWTRGTSFAQDLCTTCADLVDGAMSRRYDVVDPAAKDVVNQDDKPKATRKRAAKKTAKKAT
jgi:hypothetical protein